MRIKEQIQGKINNVGTKNVLKTLSGAMLIVLVFVLNGFLSFIVVGFEWARIATSQYWANFGLTTASEILVMYGMFLIQRTKDLQNKKITDLQKEIDTKRDVVYGMDKVTEAEDWLREIYNYKQKLLLYEKKIKHLYDKLRMVEPVKPIEPLKNLPNYKSKYKKYVRDCKKYEKQCEKYEKICEKKVFLQKQLAFVKIDKEKINLMVQKASKEQISSLDKELETDEYLFKTVKIKYKDVYWGNLLSGIDTQGNKDTTPFFNERTEVSKNATKIVGIGCIVSAFTSALTALGISKFGWAFWLDLVVKSLILITFLIRGIILSKNIILGKYYKSLEKRKAIYIAMLKDLGLSKIIFEGESDEQKSN